LTAGIVTTRVTPYFRVGEVGEVGAAGDRVARYIGVHGGRVEYWILDSVFKKVVGGDAIAKVLKHDLAGRTPKLLATEKRGNKLNYVVKRFIPGMDRVTVVAIAGRII
jgi:hypothetical protein